MTPWRSRMARGLVQAASALGLACLLLAALPPARGQEQAAASNGAPSGMGSTRQVSSAAAQEAARATQAALKPSVIDGLELKVWAPPGLVANPLTLDFDSRGRAFVVASSRAGMLLDIRQHPTWVPQVHSLRSTEALRAFFRREMAPERSAENTWLTDFNGDGIRDYRDLTVVAERIFRVEDADADGVAERSTVVHEGFNEDIASDIAGGILVHGDSLYVTVAPDLWRLRDGNGDGLFERKESISHGYSVHPAFSGHDMSALAQGPDGRIYWKIGDIGMNVVDRSGRRWELPTTGAVLRSEPDGSGFEVFAWGLRNTQEIAFDQFGNLISVDNDGDHAGESERVVYIMQGSDAGWRSTWQYGKYTDPKNNRYNVWTEENLHRTRFEGQAAYITPPIAPHHAGPSGVDFNPGTALGERWRNHFFVTSFTGGATNASVYAFQLVPDGAGFRFSGDTQIVRGLLSAGSAFGPDGALYLTDWVRGWGATGEGQLWRVDVPGGAADPLRKQVADLIAADFTPLQPRALVDLLGHADMRIRMKAQFELVERGETGLLEGATAPGGAQLARIHALWGLGQLARRSARHAAPIRRLLADKDDEVRAQAARLLGDVRDSGSSDRLIAALADASPRVRFFATEALGRIGERRAIAPIAAMLATNADRDAFLRTAGFHALAGIGDGDAVAALSNHYSPGVRLAAVVALRRLHHPGVAAFIGDRDSRVAVEAARAINDEGGIAGALPALASSLQGPVRTEAFLRRSVSANLRIGDAASARRMADFAGQSTVDQEMRVEAVLALGVWPDPSRMDRVDGAWLGEPGPRDANAARVAVGQLLRLLDDPSSTVALKVALLGSAASLGASDTAAFALRRLQQDAAADVRIAALAALRTLRSPEAGTAIAVALRDADATVRTAAIEAIPTLPVAPALIAGELMRLIEADTSATGERQRAIATLARINAPEAAAALGRLMDRVPAGIAPALQLDVLQAASSASDAVLLARLDTIGVGRKLESIAARLPLALQQGGSAQRGRQLAQRHPAAQCTRCHVIGTGESTVGPNLNGVGTRLSRPQLLESLVEPGARLAPGFDAGNGVSAMPPMGALLTPEEIRDLVEFMATLQ